MKKHLKNCYFRMEAVGIKKAGKWLTVLLVSLLAGGTAGIIYTNQLSAIRQEETTLQSEMESLLEEKLTTIKRKTRIRKKNRR